MSPLLRSETTLGVFHAVRVTVGSATAARPASIPEKLNFHTGRSPSIMDISAVPMQPVALRSTPSRW